MRSVVLEMFPFFSSSSSSSSLPLGRSLQVWSQPIICFHPTSALYALFLYYRIRPHYFLIIVRFFSPSNLFPTLEITNVCALAAILDGQLNLQYSKNLTGFIIHFIFLWSLYNVAQLISRTESESKICRQFSSPFAYKSISYTQRSIPSVALAHAAFASLSG